MGWLDHNGARIAVTLAAAAAGAVLFAALNMPLAYILGSLTGAAVINNVTPPMRGAKFMRRGSQLLVGASIGAVMDSGVLEALLGLAPLMLIAAVLANLLGFALLRPMAWMAGIDRVTALLSCLPAGMAEMATLAEEVGADEQSVAIIHTLRVFIVLTLVPLWLVATGHPLGPRPISAFQAAPGHLLALAALVAAAASIAWLATRARVINAYIVTPILLCVGLAALGITVPAVPPPLLAAAQVGIGASIGLRFRFDKMRQLPRTVVGGLVSGLLLVSVSFFGIGFAVETSGGLDHLSALLAAAPGGLSEMIATAGALGVAAASVAGFQLTRSIFTNIIIAPLVRYYVTRQAS